jgi:hypothetical protein
MVTGHALHQNFEWTSYGLVSAARYAVTDAPFQSGGEAMENIHEVGFEKNCNRNLDRCMCGAAVVQLV